MDLIFEKKRQQLSDSLKKLREVLKEDDENEFIRDATIQRFEFTAEIFWKTLKVFLEEKKIEVRSPKDVMREARNCDILSDEEVVLAIQMISDRNIASHVYSEEKALEIFIKIPEYAQFMQNILSRLSLHPSLQ